MLQTPALDEALFDSLGAALRFAYGVHAPMLASPTLGRWQATRGRAEGASALSRQDRLAQAALLRSFVDRQPAHWAAWVHAAFDQGRGRARGQWTLARWAAPRMPGDVRAPLAHALVARHFGKGVMLQDLAEQWSCHVNTMSSRARRLEELLRGLESEAQASMTSDLVALHVLRA